MIPPTHEKWKEVAERFEHLWNYPNCCGAIDSKHVRMECPINSGSAYYNYKNFHSIVLQAVVDADAKFLAVDVGDYGRNNDSGVFKVSSFGKLFFDNNLDLPAPRKLSPDEFRFPYVFVADEAYPLTRNLMRPFSRNSLTRERRIYNYRHSRARRIVECAFGMLVKKFRMFETCFLIGPENVKIVTLAACVLHNMIREREGQLADIHQELLELEEEIDDDVDDINNARASRAAYAVRNKFVDHFNSAHGSVSWQDKMALID